MPLLNYTSEVDADKTIGEINKILSKMGASSVMTDYNDGIVSALSFAIDRNGQKLGFRLPCDWKPVYDVMYKDKKAYEEHDKRYAHQQSERRMQAVRTSWRIVKDWIEAQMALIETNMAKTEQVFLPYLVVGKGETLYEQLSESQFKLLN